MTSKSVLLFLLGGLYLLVSNCQGEEAIRTAQYHTNGFKLYTRHCQNCHGAKGEGLGTLYPPLTDTEYLQTHRQQLPAIIRYGMEGPVIVAGQEFNMQMPANPGLSTIEIAYILTYITNSFGNEAGIYGVEEVETTLAAK